MNVTIKCPGCGQALTVPPNLAGRQATCPRCKSPFLIPTIPPAPKPLPVAAPLSAPAPPPPPRSGPPPLPRSAAGNSGVDLESLGISSAALGSTARAASAGAQPPVKKRPLLPAMPKWVIGAIGASAVLVAAAVGGWFVFNARGSLGDDTRFLPDDTNLVVSVDLKSIAPTSIGQAIKQRVQDPGGPVSAFGIPNLSLDAIGRVTVGVNVAQRRFCGVIHTTSALPPDFLKASGDTAKSTVGSYTMYVFSNKGEKAAAAQFDPQLLVIGDENGLRSVLSRNGPPRFGDGLADAIKEADWNKPVAVAIATDGIQQAAAAANPAMGSAVDQLRGMAVSADVGDDIRLSFAAVCKDSTVADNMRKQLDGMKAALSSRPAAALTSAEGIASKKIVDSLTISQSGATLRAAITLDSATVQGGIATASALADGAMAPRQSPQPAASVTPKPAVKPTPPNSDKAAIKPPRKRKPKKPKDPTKQPPDPAAPSN